MNLTHPHPQTLVIDLKNEAAVTFIVARSPPKSTIMANNILLPPQLMQFIDFKKQFPGPPFVSQKIFFQCELRAIQNGDAIFGVIGYPAWKKGNVPHELWEVGDKVTGLTMGPAGPNETFPVDSGDPLDPYTAFGNNELPVPFPFKSKSGEKTVYDIQHKEFLEALNKIVDNEELLKKATLEFKAKISKNPHAQYDITLSTPTGGTSSSTNPSPPAEPYEGE